VHNEFNRDWSTVLEKLKVNQNQWWGVQGYKWGKEPKKMGQLMKEGTKVTKKAY